MQSKEKDMKEEEKEELKNEEEKEELKKEEKERGEVEIVMGELF